MAFYGFSSTQKECLVEKAIGGIYSVVNTIRTKVALPQYLFLYFVVKEGEHGLGIEKA